MLCLLFLLICFLPFTPRCIPPFPSSGASLNTRGKICSNVGNKSISWPPFILPRQGPRLLLSELSQRTAVLDVLMEGGCSVPPHSPLYVWGFALATVDQHQEGSGCIHPFPPETTRFFGIIGPSAPPPFSLCALVLLLPLCTSD